MRAIDQESAVVIDAIKEMMTDLLDVIVGIRLHHGPIVTVIGTKATANKEVGITVIMIVEDKKANAWSERRTSTMVTANNCGSRRTIFTFVIMSDIKAALVTSSSNLNSDQTDAFGMQTIAIIELIHKLGRRCM